jgi:CCR4-NOT transcription complex subunit 6
MVVRYFTDNRSRKNYFSFFFKIIFFSQRFRLIKHYLVEFNQLAMSAANGTACHDMMNRVMTKDNIGLVAFLETKEEIYSHTFSNG